MRDLAYIANKTITGFNGIWEIAHEDGNTQDIVDTILFADSKSGPDTALFSEYLTATKSDMKRLWKLAVDVIDYQLDPRGNQFIKSPAASMYLKKADCKSKSIFIASVLKNLGIPYTYRFTSQSKKRGVTHVYPIAHLPSGDVIMDASPFDQKGTKYYFNREAPRAWGRDITPKGGKYKENIISGVGSFVTSDGLLIIAGAAALYGLYKWMN